MLIPSTWAIQYQYFKSCSASGFIMVVVHKVAMVDPAGSYNRHGLGHGGTRLSILCRHRASLPPCQPQRLAEMAAG